MVVGNKYNWKNQSERLVYLGTQRYSGDRGTWHRFALVDKPNEVWCELLTEDLYMIEETK